VVLPNVFTVNNPVNTVRYQVLPILGLSNRMILYLLSFIFVFYLRVVSALILILSTYTFTSSRLVIFIRESMVPFKALSTRFYRSYSLSNSEGVY